MNREERIIKLAEKGGNDATLLLLDLLHELEDKLDQLEQRDNELEDMMTKEPPEDVRVERVSQRLAYKLATLEKGDPGEPGHTPTEEELVALIEPLIPEPIPGKPGEPGPIGPKPKLGVDYTIPDPIPGPPGPPGEPGKDADEAAIVAKLENDLPRFGEKFRDGLELLEGDERLDASAIKGLDAAVRKYETKAIPGGGHGGNYVQAYDLSSSLNGSTKTFSLPAFWKIVSVHLSSAPNILRPTVDYTSDASASTITFTSEINAATSLASGQTLLVLIATTS